MRAIFAVACLAFATHSGASVFPDYLVVRDRLGWDRDNGGGRLEPLDLLARVVDESGTTLFEELHCAVPVTGLDRSFELALGTVDPSRNPLDLPFDGPWSIRILACDETACDDGIPLDPARCEGPPLLDKPLQVVGYAWRAKHASDADHARFADDCDRLDGLDSSDFMRAGTDEWVDETGDAMSGPLILSGEPTVDLHAATKKYVDEQIRNAIPRGYAILGPSLASPPGFAPSGAYIATDGEWQTLAPLSQPTVATATVFEGKIHGRTAPGIAEVYDAASDSWSAIFAPGTGQVILALDGALTVIGIENESGSHWQSLPSGAWRVRAAVPADRVESVVAHAGRIYALADAPMSRSTFWAWDPATDTWESRVAPNCTECNERTLVEFEGGIWALGGADDGLNDASDRVDMYDGLTNRWSSGRHLKRLRMRPAAAVVDGRLYVLGGESDRDGGHGGSGYGDDGGQGDSMEVFDPAVGEWTVVPSRIPSSRHLRSAVALDGKIHVLGGGSYYLRDDEATDAHEAFTPQQRWFIHVKQ